jgi:hypothetical protein
VKIQKASSSSRSEVSVKVDLEFGSEYTDVLYVFEKLLEVRWMKVGGL